MTRSYLPLFRTIVLWVGVFLIAGSPAFSAIRIAEESVVYRVEGVYVDETAQSAVQAQEIALANGQERAFQALMNEILPAHQRADASLNSADFLEDFEIQSQKFSERRFVATLTYRFNRASVKEKLTRSGRQPIAVVTAPYILVPILVENGQAKLWEEDNAWLRAWTDNHRAADSHVTLMMPLGDLSDVIALKTSDAVTLQQKAIGDFSRKYNAQGAVVAIYRAPDVAVHVVEAERITTLKVPGVPVLDQQHPDYQQLVYPILTALGRYAKQQSSPQSPQILEINLATKSVRDLLHIEAVLNKVNIIERFTIETMSAQRTKARLVLSSSITNLQFALQTNGLYLTQGQQGEWWITKTAAS